MQSKHSNDKIFAVPQKVEDVADCYFYHTVELPGYGVITGDWDLRHGVDDYLGKVAFAGQRVLEIGPASGFVTFEMEKRGAEVVSVEVTAEHGWDFVPYPASKLEEVFGPRQIVMQRLKNSYWFSHAVQHSKARLYYGDVYNLPSSLGKFDIAVNDVMKANWVLGNAKANGASFAGNSPALRTRRSHISTGSRSCRWIRRSRACQRRVSRCYPSSYMASRMS